VLSFLVIHLAPGDPVLALAGEHSDATYYAFIRAKFGLDRSLPEQLLTYMANVLQGDFGVSFVHGRPVIEIVAERLPATLLLMFTAFVVANVAGLGRGTLVACYQRRSANVILRMAALLGYAIPSFWLAQVAVLTLAVGTGLFPVQGMTDARRMETGFQYFFDVLHHLVLLLGLTSWPWTARIVRAETLSLKTREFVDAARSLGASATRILLRQVLPNALSPTVVVISFNAANIILLEAGLSFLGLGDPERISLGCLANNAQRFLRVAWWMAAFPGAAMILAILGLNLLGDALNDLLNPKGYH